MSVIKAQPIINQICRELSFTRSHVVNILRLNARSLGAKKYKRTWFFPKRSAERLKKLVASESGRRYKLGETGPRA